MSKTDQIRSRATGGTGPSQGPGARGARHLLAAPRGRAERRRPVRELAGRGGGRLPRRRAAARGRVRAHGAAAASPMPNVTSPPPSVRWSGRSVRRDWAATARRPACSPSPGIRPWPPSSSRRRAPKRRRGWSGNGCCATGASSIDRTKRRWPTSIWVPPCCASTIARAGMRELGIAGRMLESVADDFETRGERERAFDCYGVLLRLGRDTGSFETVAEGYLNGIRLMSDNRERGGAVLRRFPVVRRSSRRSGTPPPPGARGRRAQPRPGPYDSPLSSTGPPICGWRPRQPPAAGRPVDLSANAFLAAIDAATALGGPGVGGTRLRRARGAAAARGPAAPVSRAGPTLRRRADRRLARRRSRPRCGGARAISTLARTIRSNGSSTANPSRRFALRG